MVGGICGRGAWWRHAWQGVCIAGEYVWWGCAWQGTCMVGGMCGGHVLHGACTVGEMATAGGGTHPTGMHSC